MIRLGNSTICGRDGTRSSISPVCVHVAILICSAPGCQNSSNRDEGSYLTHRLDTSCALKLVADMMVFDVVAKKRQECTAEGAEDLCVRGWVGLYTAISVRAATISPAQTYNVIPLNGTLSHNLLGSPELTEHLSVKTLHLPHVEDS